MAKKQSRLKFKPTPISRLLKYKIPLKMVGDPQWYRRGSVSQSWQSRQHTVYEDMLIIKRGGWTDGIWSQAWRDNEQLDRYIAQKWNDYDRAMDDLWLEDFEAAELENFNRDYEREYFPLECVA